MKTLNITNHQKNVSKNLNEIPSHTNQDSYYPKKKREKISVSEDVDKLEPLLAAGGNIKWYSYNGKHYGGFLKNYNRITI